MLTRSPQVRLSGHGARLRLRQRGQWQENPLEALRECCRASLAIDKALGEAVRQTRTLGASWREVGRLLGVAEDAETERDILDALTDSKREVWRRFWA